MEIREKCILCCQAVRGFFNKSSDATGNKNDEKKDIRIVIENPGAGLEPRNDIPLPPVPVDRVGDVYIAQYDYNARTVEDLTFSAGDKLEALDKGAGDWWYARALTGSSASKEGYIPANYVVPEESVDAKP